MKIVTAVLASSALAFALGATAAVAAAGDKANPNHTGTPLVATLDGKAAVPAPGDPNGTGEFSGWFDAAKGRVCYTLGVASLADPTMAHIHRGAAQAAGPVVVPLANPVHDISETCTSVAPDVVKEIVANPAGFYVNVHTKAHPGGAIRAQLKKPS
jgi:hypothetical protein